MRPARFACQPVALLTRHGKQEIIGPLLSDHLNARLVHTDAFDTDSLGNFSGETPRRLTPLACATRKAGLACRLTGLAMGLGSEGSFDTGPLGLGTRDDELVTCINIIEGWTVTGHAAGASRAQEYRCNSMAELRACLRDIPPGQGLLVKADDKTGKGLHGSDRVMAMLSQWFARGPLPTVTISWDLRAHHCPPRRAIIRRATANLIARLMSTCPACHRPGFWPEQAETGLPCEQCTLPTNMIRQWPARCEGCGYQEEWKVNRTAAVPAYCLNCNP